MGGGDPKYKNPSHREPVVSERTPRYGATSNDRSVRTKYKDPSDNDHKPTWRMSSMDMDGPWSWAAISGAALRDVRTKLHNLEALTWRQILADNKYKIHAISVQAIGKEAQKRLQQIRLDDVDEVVDVRINQRVRFWGFRESAGGTLRLLWWDPEHTVYPMNIADN